MANIGLKMVYVGLKNDDGTVKTGEDGLSESGVFAIDTNKANKNLGTKSANITNLAGTTTKIWGNNVPVDVSTSKASPSVAIDSNFINPVAKEKMLGRHKTEDGVWIDSDKKVEVGLIIESQSPISLESVFYAFGRGIMTQASQNVQTNNENETREDDTLTYTALTYDKFNNNAVAFDYEGEDGFDKQKLFDLVFPGNKYDASTGKTKTTDSGNTGHQGN